MKYNFHKIYENRQDYLMTNLKDKVWAFYQKSSDKDGSITEPEQLMAKLFSLDPDEKKHSYSQWIIYLYLRGNLLFEDMDKVQATLKLFHTVKSQLEKKDIGQYKSLPELFEVLEPFKEKEEEINLFQGKAQNLIKNGEAQICYNDNSIIVISPKTLEASVFFGSSSWCTTKSFHWDHYIKQGPLFIILIKNNMDEKYQFHLESQSFMDKFDKPVEFTKLCKKYPSIAKAMDKCITLDALRKKGSIIQWMSNPSEEAQIMALSQSMDNAKYIKNISPAVQLGIVKKNPWHIQYFDKQCDEMQIEAFNKNMMTFGLLKNPCKQAQAMYDNHVLSLVKTEPEPTYKDGRIKVSSNDYSWIYADYKDELMNKVRKSPLFKGITKLISQLTKEISSVNYKTYQGEVRGWGLSQSSLFQAIDFVAAFRRYLDPKQEDMVRKKVVQHVNYDFVPSGPLDTKTPEGKKKHDLLQHVLPELLKHTMEKFFKEGLGYYKDPTKFDPNAYSAVAHLTMADY